MKFAVDKFVVQDYATALINYTFLEGPVSKLDLGLTKRQIQNVANDMLDFWGYFIESMGYSDSHFIKLSPWGVYGAQWDMYDTLEARKELSQLCEKTNMKKWAYPIISEDKKMKIQMMTKILVHYVYRNRLIEDYHSDSTTKLMDAHMKVLNKYMMDRLGFFLEQWFYNPKVAKMILDYYADTKDKFPMYNSSEPAEELKAIEVLLK